MLFSSQHKKHNTIFLISGCYVSNMFLGYIQALFVYTVKWFEYKLVVNISYVLGLINYKNIH
jgi:hypothetical protein